MNEVCKESSSMPQAWPAVRVDELFFIQQGKQVSKKTRGGENQRPFLRTKNVLWGRIDLHELDHMHFSAAEEEKLSLRHGDLLLCEGGDVGRTAIWRNPISQCYYQNHLHRLRAKNNEINPVFALYWFWHAFVFSNVYLGRKNVTTIPNMSKSRVGELLIPKPDPSEQRKTATILSLVQSAIEQQERLIALTTELKKALMHKLFTEGTRGEPQKQTEIGLIPKSWKVGELKTVTQKPQYGLTTSAVASGDYRFLRITDIQDAAVNWSSVPYCKCSSQDFIKYELKPGDLVFARIGATTGKSYLLKKIAAQAVFASYLIRVRPTAIEPGFLSFYCQTSLYWKQIEATKGNNLKGGFNSSLLCHLLVPLPCDLDEQRQIANTLDVLDNKIEKAREKYLLLNSLFRTLLHQLMTAQIRVNELGLSDLKYESMVN